MRKELVFVLSLVLAIATIPATAQTGQQTSQQQAQAAQITKGPVIENVDATSAIVAWSTNVSSSAVVRYGTDPNNLDQRATAPWGGTTHRVTIKNLQPNTRYYFAVESGQGQGTGTGALSAVLNFTTLTQQAAAQSNQGTQNAQQGQTSEQAGSQNNGTVRITKGPFVEFVDDKTAVIAWSTNVNSSTVVRYGNDRNNLNQTATAPWGGLTHRVTIKNLQPGQQYFFAVESNQAQGTGAATTSSIMDFQTLTTEQARNMSQGRQGERGNSSFRIMRGPVVEHVDDDSAIIAWSTNGASSSIVKYGTDPNNLTQTAQSEYTKSPTHRVRVENLQENTTYYFKAVSTHAQGSGAAAESPVQTVKTLTKAEAARRWQDKQNSQSVGTNRPKP
jgi:hypothetical protein